MNKEEIKIITLGDIFRNLETEEQAFEFLKYIKNLQQESQKQKETIDRAIDKLYCWGEALDPNFQKIMLDILKEVE